MRLFVDLHVDPIRQIELDRVGIAERKRRDASLDITAVPDADDVQFPCETGRDALDGIGRQGARQPMQSSLILTVALELEDPVLLEQRNAGRNGNGLLALGPFDQQLVADGYLDAFGQRNRFISYS